jgi:hypothetical protein
MNNKPSHHWRASPLPPVFLAPMQDAPKQRVPLFQFRVHCPGALKFDVQAVTAADARRHVKKRYSDRIVRVELIGEVKNHG